MSVNLLNALLGRERAIVTEIPGTTRDIITETILINSLPVIFSDTAGIRDTEDIIEAEGVKLAMKAANESDLCLFVVDGSEKISDAEINFINSLDDKAITVINKSDITPTSYEWRKGLRVSAKNKTGIEELKQAIYDKAIKAPATGSELNASAAQLKDIRESLNAMSEACELANKNFEPDVIAGLLNDARINLMRVLGIEAGDELINRMFERFCVGK